MFATINLHLAQQGLMLKEGTVVDATIISAPSSTKNKEGTCSGPSGTSISYHQKSVRVKEDSIPWTEEKCCPAIHTVWAGEGGQEIKSSKQGYCVRIDSKPFRLL